MQRRNSIISEQPQTWHYGLIAQWWAEFNTAEPDELAFYRNAIEHSGQPALDLACGTGRILLPLRHAGLNIDGCDISADMLHHCRSQAEQEGLTLNLYNQAIHTLNLPQTYRTIFICDSFGIGGQRTHDLEGLRRIHRHLAPGGVLVFSHDLPHGVKAKDWLNWLPEHRAKLPDEWSETGTRKQAANGDEIELIGRVLDLDPIEQCLTVQMRANLYQNGVKVAQEEHTIAMILYFYHEIRLMLTLAGFEQITMRQNYSDNAEPTEHIRFVFIAQKSTTDTEPTPLLK